MCDSDDGGTQNILRAVGQVTAYVFIKHVCKGEGVSEGGRGRDDRERSSESESRDGPTNDVGSSPQKE